MLSLFSKRKRKNPRVVITDVTGTHQAEKEGLEVDLGSAARKVFLLTWQGNKVPRGAVIEGNEIAWTQGGRVTTVDGEIIGAYKRLVEFGGRNGKEHQMLVFIP